MKKTKKKRRVIDQCLQLLFAMLLSVPDAHAVLYANFEFLISLRGGEK